MCLPLAGAGWVAAADPALLVAIGDPSPLGLPFSRFSDAALDDRGRVAFIGSSAAIFHHTDAGLVRLAGAGDPLGSGTLAAVAAPALAADGCLAFRAALIGGGPVIVRRCAGDLEALVTVGSTVPGGGTLTGFGTTVAVGPGGRVAFVGLLDDGETGVFRADGPGTILEVTRTGAVAPVGGTFIGLKLVGVSDSGEVGIRGQVSGGPDGLFVWDGTQLAKLAVTNDASPAGGQYTAFGGASVNGHVWAFRATISKPSGTVDGVFRATGSGPSAVFDTVVVEGQDSPIGGTFRALPTSLVPAVNAAGAVAFRSTLAGAPSSAGIFVRAPDGSIVDAVLVGAEASQGGELRRLREAVLADDGSVLVRASFAAGTAGLFAARAGMVTPLALLGDATDLGSGFRFSDPAVRATAEAAFFLGLQDGVYVSDGPGSLRTVAQLGGSSPLGGTYVDFDDPAAGPGGRIVFGATVFGGKAGEALIFAGGRVPTAPVRTGRRAPGGGELVDLFSETVDALARAGVGAGGTAFNAALGRTSANAGVFLFSGARLRAVARAGAAAGGGTLAAFGTPASVGGGQAAFVAQVRGGSSDTVILLKGKGGARTLAGVGRDTRTRLDSRYKAFDAPVGANGDVVFRATLAKAGAEGLFMGRGRQVVAVAGSGDDAPNGGRFRTFAGPTLAASNIVFLATVGGSHSARGLYRVVEPRAGALTDAAPAADTVLVAGDASPLGGTFLDFGTPRGNLHDALAFTADLRDASAPGGVFFLHDTQRSVP